MPKLCIDSLNAWALFVDRRLLAKQTVMSCCGGRKTVIEVGSSAARLICSSPGPVLISKSTSGRRLMERAYINSINECACVALSPQTQTLGHCSSGELVLGGMRFDINDS